MSDTIKETEVQPTSVVESQPTVSDIPMAGTTETDSKPEGVEAAADTATAADSTKDAEQTEKAQNGEATGLAPMLKTTAQINRDNLKANRKFDPSALEVTDDPVKIRTQVEFYFSDSNLPTDKHMWDTTGGTENKPVSLKAICSFKRMRHFQPYEAVVAALKESKALDVEGKEGEETVKRKVAYVSDSDAQKARMAASVYVKGFGDETPTLQVEIEAFFAQFGKVNKVKLRRTPEDLFKGSVFVEFGTEEEANAFVKLDPAPTWQGHELLIMKKLEYTTSKSNLIRDGKLEPTNNPKGQFFEGKIREGGRGGRGRGGRGGRGGAREGGEEFKQRREGDNTNGFKGNRGDRDQRGGRGGRGGRGRGRGDRGGGRGRGGRDGGRDAKPRDSRDVRPPVIKATNDKGEVISNDSTNAKRPREDDATSAPPAKKIDTKTETAAAQ